MKTNETIEQAAESVAKLKYGATIYGLERVNAFKEGAKWMAKRTYTFEEVLVLLNKHEDYLNDEDNIFEYVTAKEWLEQNKK